MLSRKEQEVSGIFLPNEWSNNVETALNGLYAEHCKREGKTFKVFGLSYPNEVVLTASFLDETNQVLLPVTYVASADLKKNKDPKKLIETLVDSVGLFFDNCFFQSDWNDYISVWTETEFRGVPFFYQITRENVALSIQANQLLNQ